MKYAKTINVPIYNCKVRIIFTDEPKKDVDPILKRIDLHDEDDGEYYGMALKSNKDVHYYYLIYIITGLTHNVLSHEVSHLVGFIFEDRDIDDTPSSENVAYLNGYFSQVIYDFIKKKGIQVK